MKETLQICQSSHFSQGWTWPFSLHETGTLNHNIKRNHGFLESVLADETYTHLEQCLHRPFKPWRFPRTTFRNAVSMSLFFAASLYIYSSSSSSLYIWNQALSCQYIRWLGHWFQIYRELEDEGTHQIYPGPISWSMWNMLLEVVACVNDHEAAWLQGITSFLPKILHHECMQTLWNPVNHA